MMVVSLFDSLVDALHEPMSRDVILLKPPFFIPILAVLVVCSVTAFIQSGFRFISPSSVDLEYRDIEQIPQDVLNNRRLRTLNLARNKLTNVPKCLSQTLERMHLGWNNLNEFPEDLLQCHQLNWLHIAVNPIRTIPEEIGTLTKLTVLCVCSCELRKIPSAIFKLQKLRYLDISHNCLKEFPKGVLKLASLERLDINDNKIIKIPAEIEKLVNLKVLRIHKNKLTKPLPQNLAKLVSLLELNVSNCNLANIPEFIPENLSNLTTLDIRHNRIVKLPLNFHKLTKLKCFVFVKNPLKNPPIEVCAMGLKAIRLYQEDAEKFSSVHVTRQQVMVVGEKSVGKTSLCRTLKARKPELASRDDRTIVLEETVLQELEAGVELRFTDFGGQRLYKVLHPIFLRINALVLVLFNLELYETNCEHYFKSVGFWLRKIQAKTPGVTIIPVGTKGDTVTKKKAKAKAKHVFDHAKNYVKIYRKNLEKRLEEERKKLQTIVQTDPSGTRGGSELLANIKKGIERLERMQESILNVQKPVIISSKEFHGVDELKKRILQVAETKSCALPENWYQFAKLIAERAKEDDAMYMPYAEAKELWDQATPSKKSAPTMLESIKVLLTSPMHGKFNEEDCEKFETVLTFLHRWGAILWYVSPRLKDYIFHNPKKLTNFFKAVFDHDMETTLAAKRRRRGFPEYTDVKFEEEMSWFKKKGLLTKKLLQGILAADFQGVDLDTMFSLLQHFDLCYEVQCKEQPTLYFPWFLFQSLPDDVQQLWPKTMESGVLQLTVEFHFITVVPPSLFERIQVLTHSKGPYKQLPRRDWSEGFYMSLGDIKVFVERFQYHNDGVLQVSVRGKDLGKLWEELKTMVTTMQGLLDQCPGEACNIYYICPGCIRSQIEGSRAKKEEWSWVCTSRPDDDVAVSGRLVAGATSVPSIPCYDNAPVDEMIPACLQYPEMYNEDMYELVREYLSSPQIKQESSGECTNQEAANDQGSSLDPSSHHHHHYHHYHNHYNTTYCTHNNINNCQYVQVGNENIMERVPEYLSEPPSDVEHWDLDTDLR